MKTNWEGGGIIMTSLRTLRVEFRFLEKLFNRETLKKVHML